MEDIHQYIESEKARVRKLFSSKYRTGFQNCEELSNWFIERLYTQSFRCFYCDTSIFKIKKLIDEGKLKTRKTGFGVRGPILEIDKKNNSQGYLKSNCVLSCYYCNNDKSYTTESEDYKRFFGESRRNYFSYLSGGPID